MITPVAGCSRCQRRKTSFLNQASSFRCCVLYPASCRLHRSGPPGWDCLRSAARTRPPAGNDGAAADFGQTGIHRVQLECRSENIDLDGPFASQAGAYWFSDDQFEGSELSPDVSVCGNHEVQARLQRMRREAGESSPDISQHCHIGVLCNHHSQHRVGAVHDEQIGPDSSSIRTPSATVAFPGAGGADQSANASCQAFPCFIRRLLSSLPPNSMPSVNNRKFEAVDPACQNNQNAAAPAPLYRMTGWLEKLRPCSTTRILPWLANSAAARPPFSTSPSTSSGGVRNRVVDRASATVAVWATTVTLE